MMRILAVDDDPVFREILESYMDRLGYPDVTYAMSGPEALKSIQAAPQPFDCFLCDIEMPGMNGIELVRNIRSTESGKRAPVVMITSMGDRDSVDGAFQAGAIDYLSKNETPMIQTSGKPTVDPWVYAFGLHLPYRGAIDADYANDYLEEKGLPKKVALLRFNTPLDEEVQKWQRIALQKHGIEIVDEEAIEYGAGMTNQGSQTSKMQAAGAELIVGSHGVVCAFNMLSAGQNDWDVPYLCTILYDQYAQELAGDTIYERDVMADSDGYATPDMPGPGVEKYNRVMSTFYPGYDVGLLTLYSFLGMQVFEDCAAPQGDNLTRTGIQQCLAGLNGYDGGGLVPPFTVTPTDHTAIKGAVRLKLKPDGSWENVSNGFVYPDPIHGLPR